MEPDSLIYTISSISKMTELDWIALTTAFASLITAIAALKTAKEVKKARESSIYPDLTPLLTPIYLYSEKINNDFFPLNILNEEYDKIEDSTPMKLPGLRICNVGLAVAKTVKYKFENNLDILINRINQLNEDGFFHIHKTDIILSIKIPKHERDLINHFIKNQFDEYTIDYMLPKSQDKNDNWIIIPKSYLHLWVIYVSIKSGFYSQQADNKYNIDISDFEPLVLKINYEDLNGQIHYRKFEITIDFNSLTHPKSIKESNINVGLQFLSSRIIK